MRRRAHRGRTGAAAAPPSHAASPAAGGDDADDASHGADDAGRARTEAVRFEYVNAVRVRRAVRGREDGEPPPWAAEQLAAAAAAGGAGAEDATGATHERSTMQESHQEPVFGAQFNPFDPTGRVFAAVGANRATIYRCGPGTALTPLQVYEDDNRDEKLYTCTWLPVAEGRTALLVFAGEMGIIRLADPSRHAVATTLVGHGAAVNDLRGHPNDPALLLSASKDYSVRLWNVRTKVCIAIFGGVEGHRDAVLSLDVHHTGERMVSAGMDNAVKFWSLTDPVLLERVQAAATFNVHGATSFPSLSVHYPTTTAATVHRNYIDCVRYFGDLVLSKSTDSRILLWQPPVRGAAATAAVQELHDFRMAQCNIWYVRFCVDVRQRLVFCGNQEGRIFVWDADHMIRDGVSIRPTARVLLRLAHPRSRVTLRHVTLSPDGRALVATSDDGHVWWWEAPGADANENGSHHSSDAGGGANDATSHRDLNRRDEAGGGSDDDDTP